MYKYRRRAIITPSLYTFYPLFEVYLSTVTFGLMYGYYLLRAYNSYKGKILHNFKTKLCHFGHSAQQEWLFHYLRFRDCFAISWLYSYSTTLRSKGLVTSCACWNFFFGQNSRQLAPGKNYRPMWSETRRRQHPLTSKKFFLNSKKQEYSWFILNKLEFFGFPIVFISV